MILPALLTVLALAGAPASTKVDCNPDLPATVELGLTVSDEAQIVNGQIVLGRLDHIILGQLACGALLYGSLSPSERLAVRRMNPRVDFNQLVGVGLQVALHEAFHVGINSTDECQVEKATRSQVNGLIEKVGDQGQIQAEEAAATASDASLPARYHGC